LGNPPSLASFLKLKVKGKAWRKKGLNIPWKDYLRDIKQKSLIGEWALSSRIPNHKRGNGK
jgi:hypothetical protein